MCRYFVLAPDGVETAVVAGEAIGSLINQLGHPVLEKRAGRGEGSSASSDSVDRAPGMRFRDYVAETFPSVPHATPVAVPWSLSDSAVRLFMICGLRSPLFSQFMAC